MNEIRNSDCGVHPVSLGAALIAALALALSELGDLPNSAETERRRSNLYDLAATIVALRSKDAA